MFANCRLQKYWSCCCCSCVVINVFVKSFVCFVKCRYSSYFLKYCCKSNLHNIYHLLHFTNERQNFVNNLAMKFYYMFYGYNLNLFNVSFSKLLKRNKNRKSVKENHRINYFTRNFCFYCILLRWFFLFFFLLLPTNTTCIFNILIEPPTLVCKKFNPLFSFF